MTVHLPEDLEHYIQSRVQSGRNTSADDVLAEALRLLRQHEDDEEARVLEGIRLGLEDVRAGRTEPLADAFANIRRDLKLPQGS